MFASPRRLSVSLSSRPWLYWLVVALAAAATGSAAQHIAKPPTHACVLGASGVARPGTRGISVPLGEPALPLHVGDHVDIVGIATDLTVLQVTEVAAVVGVPEDHLDEVVAALRARTTVLGLVP